MALRMEADAKPVVTDLVLVGSGVRCVHAEGCSGCSPPGVASTLITRDVETPYSGMLPGRVAGVYSRRGAHIDANKVGATQGTRLIAGA